MNFYEHKMIERSITGNSQEYKQIPMKTKCRTKVFR